MKLVAAEVGVADAALGEGVEVFFFSLPMIELRGECGEGL